MDRDHKAGAGRCPIYWPIQFLLFAVEVLSLYEDQIDLKIEFCVKGMVQKEGENWEPQPLRVKWWLI